MKIGLWIWYKLSILDFIRPSKLETDEGTTGLQLITKHPIISSLRG